MTKKGSNLESKKDKIIILQTIRHLESHLIVKGLNQEGFVLSFFARSALKSKKRFGGGVLEPGHYVQAEYTVSSKPEGWNQLKGAFLIYSFGKIRQSYERLQLCLYFLKMVNSVGEATRAEPEVFHLLGNGLKAIETFKNLEQLKLFFEIRFLYIQGVLPHELQEKSCFLNNNIQNCDGIDLSSENLSAIQNYVREALFQYLGYSKELSL